MLREIIVAIYLVVFKIIFNIVNIAPLKNKVTFIMSYGENLIFIYEEMKRQHIDCEVVFLYKSTCKYEVKNYPDVKAVAFETKNIIQTIKAIYHLATSRYVIIDNYFGSLSTIRFKKRVECIQIWHAAGAFKKFGLLAPAFKKRSKYAQGRFLRVYNNFHKIVVGSDALAEIYKQAFGLKEESILKTGIPRTDLFFYENDQKVIINNLVSSNPNLTKKKVILYAPTFRDKELEDFDLDLNIDAMYEALKDEYIFIIKLHPAIRNNLEHKEKYKGFLYDYSLYPNINDLFLVTDILITDYSSVPFEFCLLKKPMIFFAYDLNKYAKKRGLIGDFVSNVPGPVVFSSTEIIKKIQTQSFDFRKIEQFNAQWSQYSNGNSSRNLVHYLFNDNNSKR
ncbi:CDP-glycerol glycerophosphotransferase family protein [Bacillus anthracis]|uniref:CDP-glycerol glycerophosphotransferase family protein n=1 Tax=Bacillus TaxID=1386 RepID=UPI001928307C|nr:CDP-glycerol glycerophosphotransferase family protein [Bacillus anthracis]MBL3848635.1 CDP-glycerol glycerophosphotransferase family protein [Bacillus cereus]MDR4406540.1 CDP-glycerol glycerophosphotransferase family protein [Bacillus anthracis]